MYHATFGTSLNIPEKERSYCIYYIDYRNKSEIRLSNCTHEKLFKALARLEAKLATTTIKDKTK
jgi:hypothetical protein